MSIQRNDSLFFAAPKSGDSRYDNDGAGYANVSAVNVAIISSYRFIGLTVNVQGVEYWYRDGILDGDLIEKELGNSLQNISDSSGNNLLVGGNNSGSVTLTGNSSDTNADFIVVPQGTGTFKLGGNHQANITDDDDVITKGFADANYSSSVSAAGANTQVQFNNAGSFGASSNLTFASDTLTVNGTDVGDGLIEMSNASINLILASNLNSYAAFGVSSSQALDYTEGAYFKADGVTLGGDAIIAAGEGADVIVFTENTERLRILTNGNATVNGVWDFQANVISNVANPSSDQAAATKNYVDGLVVGFEVTTNKGAANGYTPLDANSKVSVTYLDVFDSSDSGIVPGSGGGTTNFLRADGTWAAPTGFNESGLVTSSTALSSYTFIVGSNFGSAVHRFNSVPLFSILFANGAEGSESFAVANENIGRIDSRPWAGTDYATNSAAYMQFVANENQASGSLGSRIEFATVADGSSSASLAMTIEADGSLSLESHDILNANSINANSLNIDAISEPGTPSSGAIIYVDSADSDLKVKFSNGTVQTLAMD